MSIWIWETFTITDKHGQKRVSPRLITKTILNTQNGENILKATREKHQATYQVGLSG